MAAEPVSGTLGSMDAEKCAPWVYTHADVYMLLSCHIPLVKESFQHFHSFHLIY